MKTIDSVVEHETIQSELALFWNEISQNLPKSRERSALGDEKIFTAFAATYPKMREHIFHAGAAAMLERVREGVPKELPTNATDLSENHAHNGCRNTILSHLDTLQKELEGNK